jgi:hypothetical protein
VTYQAGSLRFTFLITYHEEAHFLSLDFSPHVLVCDTTCPPSCTFLQFWNSNGSIVSNRLRKLLASICNHYTTYVFLLQIQKLTLVLLWIIDRLKLWTELLLLRQMLKLWLWDPLSFKKPSTLKLVIAFLKPDFMELHIMPLDLHVWFSRILWVSLLVYTIHFFCSALIRRQKNNNIEAWKSQLSMGLWLISSEFLAFARGQSFKSFFWRIWA